MKGSHFPFLSASVNSSESEISREKRQIWSFKPKKLVLMDSVISQLVDTCILNNDHSKQV